MSVLQEITAWLWLFVAACIVGFPLIMLTRIVRWTYETTQAVKATNTAIDALRESIDALNRSWRK